MLKEDKQKRIKFLKGWAEKLKFKRAKLEDNIKMLEDEIKEKEEEIEGLSEVKE